MQTVTVYTTGPTCQKCNNTKRWLNNRGIPFIEVDVTQDAKGAARIKPLGYAQAPVVVISNGDPEADIHWSEFNPIELGRHLGQVAA